MGIAKKDLEKEESENMKTGIFCSRCGNEIPKEYLVFSGNKDNNLCVDCVEVQEKINKE